MATANPHPDARAAIPNCVDRLIWRK